MHRKERKKLEKVRELLIKGKSGEARRLCLDVLKQNPENGRAYDFLGSIEAYEKKPSMALKYYRQAIHHGFADHGTYNNLGLVLSDLGEQDEALEMFQKALQLRPRDLQIYYNLGFIYTNQRRFAEGKDIYLKVLSLAPNAITAYFRLTETLWELGEIEQARTYLEKLFSFYSGKNVDVQIYLLHTLQHIAAWREWKKVFTSVRLGIEQKNFSPIPLLPFTTLTLPLTPNEQKICAQSWSQAQYDTYKEKLPEIKSNFAHSSRRIRVAYMSSDFKEHPVAAVMAGIFEHHDRNEFEIIAYSYGEDDGGPLRKRLQGSFERFYDVRKLSLIDTAKHIVSDEIDILVDLNGYTAYSRSSILASRLAPIQLQGIGYPGTLGNPEVDYIIADNFIIPESLAEHYEEKIIWMPDTYLPRDNQQAISKIPELKEAGLPTESFIFCSFNQTYKILPDIFNIWMEILKAVPQGILWLKDHSRIARENFKREAVSLGVEPERLIFASKLPELADHLGRLGVADLYLDTFPYNGHTTLGDALWVGVPGITCSGETFPSRVGGSLLNSVGLGELVATHLESYKSLAINLAGNPSYLAEIKRKLLENRDSAPLFDTSRYTRNLENAYKLILARAREGLKPENISIASQVTQ